MSNENALKLADHLRGVRVLERCDLIPIHFATDELRRQHAEIQEQAATIESLRAQLAALRKDVLSRRSQDLPARGWF